MLQSDARARSAARILCVEWYSNYGSSNFNENDSRHLWAHEQVYDFSDSSGKRSTWFKKRSYDFSDLKKSKRSTIDMRLKFFDDTVSCLTLAWRHWCDARRSDELMWCRIVRSTTWCIKVLMQSKHSWHGAHKVVRSWILFEITWWRDWNIMCKFYDNLKLQDACVTMCLLIRRSDEVIRCRDRRSTTTMGLMFWCNRNARDMTRIKLYDHGSCWWAHDDKMWNMMLMLIRFMRVQFRSWSNPATHRPRFK